MRIVKISVKKLFGVYDHEIPLNQESRITILHGPNGVGKTIVLTMLNGLFNANYRAFEQVSYDEFRVVFDTEDSLAVCRDNGSLSMSYDSDAGTETVAMVWESGDEPPFLSHIRRDVRVALIKTQRLQTEVAIDKPTKQRDSGNGARPSGLAVEEQTGRVAFLIQEMLGTADITASEIKELKRILGELEESVERSDDAHKEVVAGMREHLDHLLPRLIAVSRQAIDFKDKVGRLNLLVELLNQRYSFKRVYTDGDSGLVIVSHDDSLIPVSSLSSGEQHQLVLFSKLLFDVPDKSLVLIDEPELSLHVSWKRDFLDDLQRIINMRDFDTLIATHSPQIANTRFEWMVDMSNPALEDADEVA